MRIFRKISNFRQFSEGAQNFFRILPEALPTTSKALQKLPGTLQRTRSYTFFVFILTFWLVLWCFFIKIDSYGLLVGLFLFYQSLLPVVRGDLAQHCTRVCDPLKTLKKIHLRTFKFKSTHDVLTISILTFDSRPCDS